MGDFNAHSPALYSQTCVQAVRGFFAAGQFAVRKNVRLGYVFFFAAKNPRAVQAEARGTLITETFT